MIAYLVDYQMLNLWLVCVVLMWNLAVLLERAVVFPVMMILQLVLNAFDDVPPSLRHVDDYNMRVPLKLRGEVVWLVVHHCVMKCVAVPVLSCCWA